MSGNDEAVPSVDPVVHNNNEDTEKPSQPRGPTESHVLAQIEQDEKGLAQKDDTTETTDIGWGQSGDQIEESLVAGLSNEDLWMLIRRFNKQVYAVKAVPDAPLQRLDLTRTAEEEFSPDKLRATLERFYITIVVGLTSAIKHVARLRSWKESRRTAVFCAVYFIAWMLDFLAPTFFAVLIALVIYPPCRPLLFPPAPIALVDKNTGGVQKPKAGVLGSHDSITGAPEKFKGEAAEQEASNLVASVASVAVGSAVGKHDQGVPEDAPLEGAVPDAMEIVSNTADAQSAAHGKVPLDSHDKTRQPVREAVMSAADLLMQMVSDLTDTYEKFGNALSATPPFPRMDPRLRLVSVLAPACLASIFVSSYMLIKMTGLVIGIAFFGDPLIRRSITYLNHKVPHWQKFFELQNSLLKGIPTNAQLTLTLLRIGETNASPLPPPPTSRDKPPSRPASLHHEQLALGATTEEIKQAASGDLPDSQPSQELQLPFEVPHKSTWAANILGFFRGTTATGVESKRAIDRVRALAGSRRARNKVGILRRKGQVIVPVGPVEFDARYKGRHGTVVLDSSKEPMMLYFTTDHPQGTDLGMESRKKGSVLFSLPVPEIQEMKKLGGMGWKGKLLVGWAMGSKEVVDGLLIVGKEPGQSYQLTAMGTRNQLFNRLVAIDGQVWESC
ncbi:hypothetical protein N7474_004127 [Penicillium riverlandense]|uniref:uncharacterized protein n=1 Tax=Penicillium riverlandense TaxID=1903569 RepID=UPI00254901E6|nr:uncharacterized protein N7474_004127 [Penicillium riverlandense]KAJ5818536.1 hypothetical protein N7474_004127 [Penicillium riverlandense]